MALPTFLKHLRVLEDSDLIETTKSGRIRTCRLNAETAKVAEDWLCRQRRDWEARLDRLDAFLTAPTNAPPIEKGEDDGP